MKTWMLAGIASMVVLMPLQAEAQVSQEEATDVKSKAAKATSKVRDALGGPKSKCSVGGTPIATVLAEFGRCPSPEQTVDDGGATEGPAWWHQPRRST